MVINILLSLRIADGCRDGQINPNADRGDYEAAIKLGDAVQDLGLAYAFTGEAKYADKAIGLIRGWSLDSTTRMKPISPCLAIFMVQI
ncbi:MAG: hypothetical protein GXP17_08690 [Gammaproteobacteria bacterium]|nr:hypothetical protein [Gammaproteobacteria bacterium]